MALTAQGQTFGIHREAWTNLNTGLTNTLAALTNAANNPGWPNTPAAGFTTTLPTLELNPSGQTNFGQRFRAFVVPATDGAHTFSIAADDLAELSLSLSEDPATAVKLAGVTNATGFRIWNNQTNQSSPAVTLVAGQRYYLDVRTLQGGGTDHVSIRWKVPGGNFEEPLAATNLSGSLLLPYRGIDTPPVILRQPMDLATVEGAVARFAVLASNASPVTYRWRINGTNSSVATTSVYVAGAALPTLNGATFACVISNAAGTVTSMTATLLVAADTNPPIAHRAFGLNATNVQLDFSEPLLSASATNEANYTFPSNAVSVTRVFYTNGATSVWLVTSAMSPGTSHWVRINQLRDTAWASNVIASNTQLPFVPLPYTFSGVGATSPAVTIAAATGGIDLLVTAGSLGGTNDQLGLGWELRTGDFDIGVRVAGLTLADSWTKAALIARDSMDPGSRFAAAVATPAMNGCFMEWRDAVAAASRKAGAFPANGPLTWLRLKRSGTNFTGYAGYDGRTWTQLTSVGLPLSNQVYVGLASAAGDTNETVLAAFRDMTNYTGTVTPVENPSPWESIGPSTRRTPIAISEIMYRPAPRTDSNNVEFIELYNSNPWFHDISGYRLKASGLDYTFPTGTIVAGGGFVVAAASPAALATVYGVTNVYGPYTGSLKRSDTLKLFDEWGSELLVIEYGNARPWPVAADQAGHSLVLARPTYGEDDPRAWDISSRIGGTPGGCNAYDPDPLDGVMINEILAHTDPPLVDLVELYNHGNTARDLSGAWLSNSATTNKYRFPNGTILPARGFLAVTETSLGFRLDTMGERVYLVSSNQTRVVDAVDFDGQENGVSLGRVPDGGTRWYRLASRTPGTNNGAIRAPPVVINEIMYNPISGSDDDQYVELFNRSGAPVDIGGWKFTEGISYTFPTNTTVAAGGYLVVAKNAARLRSKYPQLNFVNCLGDFGGRLSGSGERLVLAFPDDTINTNTGVAVTNHFMIPVCEVTYGTGGRWGLWSDGGGSSLELRDPDADTALAQNWGDSDETAKAPWTTIEVTGTLDHGSNFSTGITNAQAGILDVGECLLDDVEIYEGTNLQNLVRNPTFEAGTTNWYLEGAHMRSSLENEGYNGSAKSLHLRASSRVWTGGNSCEFNLLTNGMVNGSTATIRYRARWLRGWPEIYLRLNGNWLEATGPMTLPANLGSPGLQNSRFVTNAGPALFGVIHGPTVPAANQAVVVTTGVHDPDGVASVTLRYRIDPVTNQTSVAMKDDGTGGDAIAGDGVYSATIPGQASNAIAAFSIVAADIFGVTNRFPELRGINEPDRECVVLFGEGQPVGSFSVYRLWLTQTSVSRWTSQPDLSNESHDGTMVNGNRVIYNAVARYAGSPYHQQFNSPYGNLCHYKWTFPEDDRFLGQTSFNKIHQPGNSAGDDGSLQREQTAHTFLRALGVPWLNRRYMVVYINGNRRGWVMEDTQTPDSSVVDQWFPGDKDGWLYKMQPWFEFPPAFTDSGTAQNKAWCYLNRYLGADGGYKTARYRWNYMIRTTPTSANDFTNVFTLIDAAYSPSNNFATAMKNVADMENWMRVFAANHAAGNWDSFGANNSQNLYGYIGLKGTKYSLLMWDYNIVIGWTNGPNACWPSVSTNLFTYNNADANMDRIYRNPEFRRMYLRALQELTVGPMAPEQFGPLLDAKYRSFIANGFVVESPDRVSSNGIKTWLATAQTSIAAQVQSANVSNFTVNTSVSFSNNVALVSGSAPFEVKTVLFNGIEWPLEWITPTTWVARVVAMPGTSVHAVTAVNLRGQSVAGSTGAVTIVYNSVPPSPAGRVVINEIMYRTNSPGGQFIELFNTSTNTSFDLSGWQLNGVGYTFPTGSSIGAGACLTLCEDRRAFTVFHGATNPPFGVFSGRLDTDGETLSLLAPQTGQTTVVCRVRYEAAAPWPVFTNAASLQAIDATNDITRAGNWYYGKPAAPPDWTYFSATTYAYNATNFAMFLGVTPGELYVDDVRMVLGTNGVGPSLVTNGDFEAPLAGTWNLGGNFSNSLVVTNVKHGGTSALKIVAAAPGTGGTNAIWQPLGFTLSNLAFVTVSFWYIPTTNATSFTVKPDPGILDRPVYPVSNFPRSVAAATPGTTNSIVRRLTAFPRLWLNEVSLSNTTVALDNAGEREPWVELHYGGTGTLSLAGLYLSDNYTNLTQWAFPTNATVAANTFRVIWCDAQTNQTSTNQWHANFRLPAGSGQIALSRLVSGETQVVDYLNYTNVPVNWSYGDIPDAQPFYRTLMYLATPGATNNGAVPAATVSINEWLADNLTGLTNPVGGQHDDWFELYNWGPAEVNVGGFYLTDDLANPNQWMFPTNTTIPAGGFLLVWADGATNANGLGLGVHAGFKLSKSGEQLGLYSPSLVPVDTVTFSAQATDVTQGRWPDADANMFTLAVPTPGSNNIASLLNSAPSFTNNALVFADEMTSVQVDGSAFDGDAPQQSVTYALQAGPAGATIDTNTGTIAWLPGESDGPSTNTLQVVAVDNGWPPLAATQTFMLVIREVNQAPTALPAPAVPTYVGSLTSIGIPASDPDIPANALTYELLPGGPAGATLETNLGVVTWTPTLADAGSVVSVPVLIRDHGTPALSATGFAVFSVGDVSQTLAVGVTQPASLTWTAASGSIYRIEYADELMPVSWQHLTNVTAMDSGVQSIPLSVSTNTIRFYRLFRSP